MTRLSAMLLERGLDAHKDKTCYLVCGSESYKNKTNKQLKIMPLKFGDLGVGELGTVGINFEQAEGVATKKHFQQGRKGWVRKDPLDTPS